MAAKAYLHVTFCHIERSDTGVGDTTGKDTAQHALGVVCGVMRNLGVDISAEQRKTTMSNGHNLE